MTVSKRDTLIQTALRLFCAHGVHAVGVDRVIAEAGVAKATLYKHFRSKEDLVLAALERLDDVGRAGIAEAARGASKDPRRRFAFLADAVSGALSGAAPNGCIFVLAAQEFPDGSHPVHRAAADHKRRMRELFTDLAREAGARDPKGAGERAQLVLDGLYSACAMGDADRARAAAVARQMLLALLD